MRHQGLSTHIVPNTYAIHSRGKNDGAYKKEHLAKFQFLVEASDPNANFPLISLLLRIVYRNYITTDGKLKVLSKSLKDAIVSLGKWRRSRKLRQSYFQKSDYRYLD